MGRTPMNAKDRLARSRAFASQQKQREKALIAKDQIDRADERLRREAEIEFEDGSLVAMRDFATGPTPEQISHAERDGTNFRQFTPRLPDGSVATVTAYRRRDVPQAHKMMMMGVIDSAGMSACIHYRNLYERTGLDGAIRSVDYGKEVFGGAGGRGVFTDTQLDAQDLMRFIKRNIPSRYLRLLDKMVLEDVPINRAVRAARAFHRLPKPAFGKAVEYLRDAIKKSEC